MGGQAVTLSPQSWKRWFKSCHVRGGERRGRALSPCLSLPSFSENKYRLLWSQKLYFRGGNHANVGCLFGSVDGATYVLEKVNEALTLLTKIAA